MPIRRSRIVLPPAEYKKLVNLVHRRDGWKCRVKGCKARQNLHAHHIVYRSAGGDDIASNLCTMCERCHSALHDRFILIKQLSSTGEAVEVIDAGKPIVWVFLDNWLPGKRI